MFNKKDVISEVKKALQNEEINGYDLIDLILKDVRVYRCYNDNEAKILKDNGICYLIKCKDIKSNRIMRLYVRTNKFNELIDKIKFENKTENE